MTKKTWIVWALLFVLPGIVGLSIQRTQKRAVQNSIAAAGQQVAGDSVSQEYLQMYEQWSDLPAAQKADNPWGYGSFGGSDIQKQLTEGQSTRLLADISTLEKGFVHYPNELADIMYGFGWMQEVDRYKKKQAVIEMILIVSIFLLACGGLILAGGLAKLLAVRIIKKPSEKTDESDADEADPQSVDIEDVPVDDDLQEDLLQAETASLVPKEEDVPVKKNEHYFRTTQNSNRDGSSKSEDRKATKLPMKPAGSMLNYQEKKKKDSYFGWAIEAEESEEIETMMTTEPLTKELTELTEEVSAIRHFAAQQQDQMRKLQDGYDWVIIRRFCLRIIRCIDNIDDRVVNLYDKGEEAVVYLEDIRDELVYALEASGIEQFGPDLQSPFKGLEKYAEAVRERIYTEDTGLVGCIAEVARPGYQYLVNDDDVKIVRCAQVKLYEPKQT